MLEILDSYKPSWWLSSEQWVALHLYAVWSTEYKPRPMVSRAGIYQPSSAGIMVALRNSIYFWVDKNIQNNPFFFYVLCIDDWGSKVLEADISPALW